MHIMSFLGALFVLYILSLPAVQSAIGALFKVLFILTVVVVSAVCLYSYQKGQEFKKESEQKAKIQAYQDSMTAYQYARDGMPSLKAHILWINSGKESDTKFTDPNKYYWIDEKYPNEQCFRVLDFNKCNADVYPKGTGFLYKGLIYIKTGWNSKSLESSYKLWSGYDGRGLDDGLVVSNYPDETFR